MEVVKPFILTTKRGKPSLVLDGYMYRIHKQTDIISWACIKDKKTKCKGKIKTTLAYDIVAGTAEEHSCLPNAAEVEVKKILHNCKKRVREEVSVPVNVIYKEEFASAYARGYELVTEVPMYENIKGKLCEIRRKNLGSNQNPVDCTSISFPEELLQLPNQSSFLIIDKVITPGKRILVFGTEESKQVLEQGSMFFLDGTFKSCPRQFAQLYTIHADIGSTETETNICPVLFALLPDKTEFTYISLFQSIKEWYPEWCPTIIKQDFELAVMSAVGKVYPDTVVSGCGFHFGQCLWRKIQNLGLTTEYRNDNDIKRTCKQCAALAYLPLNFVDDAWLIIMEDAPNNEKLQLFLNYFVDNWLDNPKIPVKVWNVNDQRHRTNNAVEGWNSKFNSIIGRREPNIFYLVDKLKHAALESSFQMKSKELGCSSAKRRKTYVQLDRRIDSILCELEQTHDLRKCLNALCYVNKLD